MKPAYGDAVANALCRHDYETGTAVEVNAFMDTVQIVSPGLFPEGDLPERHLEGVASEFVVVRGCCPMKRGPRRGGRRGRKKEKGPFCYAEARAFFEARYPLTTLNARASPDCTCIG